MKNQFNVAVSFKELANAASFLKSAQVELRSRNQLVNQCVGYLSQLAEQEKLDVATDEVSGLQFLLSEGLAGEASKAVTIAAKQKLTKNFSGFSAIAEQVAADVRSKKNSFKDNKDSLFLFCQSVASEKGEAGFSEVMKLLASSKFAEDEEFRKKVTKLFSKEE